MARSYTIEEELEVIIADAIKKCKRVREVASSRENSLVMTKLEESEFWNMRDRAKKGQPSL